MLQHRYQQYLGRFAPSPTGPLHYGSLVTAVASYLQSRSNNGRWLIRIENIDPPREQAGATSSILQTLHDYGFRADQKPILQNRQFANHKHQAIRLINSKHAYVCECSRKYLNSISTQGDMGTVYPGICRHKNLPLSPECNIRVDTKHCHIEFTDGVYGKQYIHLNKESGDYVIFRRNNLPSYILAVSIDDTDEQYTEVVRGHDLLAITSRQIHLSQLLRRTPPLFMHIPLITDGSGMKLSKQTHAPALSKHHARAMLFNALLDLGQEPPNSLRWRSLESIWEWAIFHWRSEDIPAIPSIPYRL